MKDDGDGFFDFMVFNEVFGKDDDDSGQSGCGTGCLPVLLIITIIILFIILA